MITPHTLPPKGDCSSKMNSMSVARAREARQKPFFDVFWENYPRKQLKKRAFKVWCKINPDKALVRRILMALSEQWEEYSWETLETEFIPLASTWLVEERWEDLH